MEIAMAYSALTAAFQLAKGLKDVHDQVKINEIVIELQGRIMEAQEAVRDGRDKLSALENELTALRSWERTAARYFLKDFGGSTFAYELKPAEADGEPIHRLCPACFEEKKRSVLQFEFRDSVGREHYKCIRCSSKLEFGHTHSGRW